MFDVIFSFCHFYDCFAYAKKGVKKLKGDF